MGGIGHPWTPYIPAKQPHIHCLQCETLPCLPSSRETQSPLPAEWYGLCWDDHGGRVRIGWGPKMWHCFGNCPSILVACLTTSLVCPWPMSKWNKRQKQLKQTTKPCLYFFPKSKVNIPRSNCDHVVGNVWDAILRRKAPLFAACKNEAALLRCNPLAAILFSQRATSLLNNPRVQMVAAHAAPIRVLQEKTWCFSILSQGELDAPAGTQTDKRTGRQTDERRTDGPAWSGMKNNGCK